MRAFLCLTILLLAESPQTAMADVVGTQCWINGKLVGGFPAGYTCPGTGVGGSSGTKSSGVNSSVYGGFYQLGYAFGQWLFSSDSDPEAEHQKQQMMAELHRRQAEAERQHREEEARRLAAMYNRLLATLKLSGLPNLQLKESSNPGSELKLKLGDSGSGQAGINGLPGMYLDDDKKPYGIPGLPGIYTGGPGQGSGLQLKLGQSGVAAAAPVTSDEPEPSNAVAPALQNEPSLQLKTGANNTAPAAQVAVFDPSKMTPQQLADVAEQFSHLPPEEQQRLLTRTQPSTQARSAPQQQADASRAAANAPTLEDASAKARAGFDQPIGAAAPVQLGKSETPSTLRPPGKAVTVNRTPPAASATTGRSSPGPGEDWVKLYLFPGGTSPSSRAFPKNPNPPLTNPLREEKELQARLKAWDEWAVERATHVALPPGGEQYPLSTERKMLNSSTVKQYAPQLVKRYERDPAFQQSVDSQLQQVNEKVAFDYYQALANAHKTAILDFQTELEKLALAGKLDTRIALEDQYRLHPERRQLVQSTWDRISAREQAAEEQALKTVGRKLEKEYQSTLRRIQEEAAQQH